MAYVPRLVDPQLRSLLAALPAVMLVGPRACGKTTSAARLVASTVRLDRPYDAAAFQRDPDAALARFPEPLLIDEWQEVPDVLGAVKRAVDVDFRPNRFILTGSVSSDLHTPSWPGTGRITRVRMSEMTQAEEAQGDNRLFIDRLAAADFGSLPFLELSLEDYLERALRGGFPEPMLNLPPFAAAAWYEGYVDQLLSRDARNISRLDPARLRGYLEALATQTAGVVDQQTLIDAVGINRKSAVAYENLLEALFVLEKIPAWSSNRLTRLSRLPKRVLTDAALLRPLLRITPEKVADESALLGRTIETFVATQLRAELGVSPAHPRLFHLRDRNGRREIDFIVEYGPLQVAAIEVKANVAPDEADARHLAWFRDQIGERFTCGVVMHTGPAVYPLGEKIWAVPIAAMWV